MPARLVASKSYSDVPLLHLLGLACARLNLHSLALLGKVGLMPASGLPW